MASQFASHSPVSLGESSRSGAAADPSPADPGSVNSAIGGSGAASAAAGADNGNGSSSAASIPKRAGSETEDGAPKKQKFSRSRTACLQCRSRKSKCGALPPHPCPNCIEAELQCQWPTEDGRSSKARLQRSRSSHLAALSTRGMQQPTVIFSDPVTASASTNSGMTNATHVDLKPDIRVASTPDGVLSEGWLDRLLAGEHGTSTNVSNFQPDNTPTSVSTFQPTPAIPPPSATFVTPMNPVLPPARFPFSPSSSTGVISSYPTLAPPAASSSSFYSPLTNPSAVDPAQFVWAVSSRLPTVEEGSPNDERSSASGPSPVNTDPAARAQRRAAREARARAGGSGGGNGGQDGKIVKVTWWRPHGQTAIAPGLKKITLKVRVNTPQDTWQKGSPQVTVPGPGDTPQELIAPDGIPSTPIMRHLLDVFMTHFGSRTGSVFLLLSIAAIAARFSTHPAVALPNLQPYEYGNVFYTRAKALLGSMLAVPSRETVAAFILLAHMGFANDSESEVWMMTGLAVRMSIDAGLHMNPPDESTISSDERRLNRLVFWSVLLMDYALSFGVGRQTAFRPEDITQTVPSEEDMVPASAAGSTPAAADTPRSPFPFAAKMMVSYGPLINMLNRGEHEQARAERERSDRDIQSARAAAIREYNLLPADMQWNVTNLQRHSRNNQGSIFLHLHLWMHTILASGFLTGSSLLRRSIPGDKLGNVSVGGSAIGGGIGGIGLGGSGLAAGNGGLGARSGAATPNSATASTLWRNSARTIGDILVLSDIINPYSYFALPFVNQAFFVAGCCYVKEIEQHAIGPSAPSSPVGSPRHRPTGLSMTPMEKAKEGSANGGGGGDGRGQVDLSRALLTSVATTNISTLQQGLAKLATYWVGAEWIAGALGQRIEGIHDVDLVTVSEKLASFVSLPDAGLVRTEAGANGDGSDSSDGDGNVGVGVGNDMAAAPSTGYGMMFPPDTVPTPGPPLFGTDVDFSDLDFLSLPFDLGSVEGGSQNVTEQDIPIGQVLQPEWFR